MRKCVFTTSENADLKTWFYQVFFLLSELIQYIPARNVCPQPKAILRRLTMLYNSETIHSRQIVCIWEVIFYEFWSGGVSFDVGWPWKVKLKVTDFHSFITVKPVFDFRWLWRVGFKIKRFSGLYLQLKKNLLQANIVLLMVSSHYQLPFYAKPLTLKV